RGDAPWRRPPLFYSAYSYATLKASKENKNNCVVDYESFRRATGQCCAATSCGCYWAGSEHVYANSGRNWPGRRLSFVDRGRASSYRFHFRRTGSESWSLPSALRSGIPSLLLQITSNFIQHGDADRSNGFGAPCHEPGYAKG